MVEKKLGAEMDCDSCGTHITCNKKTYAAFKDKPERTVLQWQNEDGTAHYKWISEGKYDCIIPNEIELKGETQTITQETTTAYVLPVTLDSVYDEIKLQEKMLESILHIIIDLKREVKEKNAT